MKTLSDAQKASIAVHAMLASYGDTASLELISVQPLGMDSVVTFRTDGAKHEGKAYHAAFAGMLGEKGSLVEGSVFAADESKHVYKGIIKSAVVSKKYSDEIIASDKMTLVTANVFSDEDDNIWQVVGEGDSRSLVRKATEDFSQVLSMYYNHSIVANDSYDHADVTPGFFVGFFDTDRREMSYGMVHSANTDKVSVFTERQQIVEVAPSALVAGIAPDNNLKVDTQHIQTASTDFGMAYVDYLRTLYGSNIPYIQALETLIKSHSVA